MLELRNAIVIARAKKNNVAVQKENVEIRDEDGGENRRSTRTVGFEVTPINMPNLKERYFMIVFHEKTE